MSGKASPMSSGESALGSVWTSTSSAVERAIIGSSNSTTSIGSGVGCSVGVGATDGDGSSLCDGISVGDGVGRGRSRRGLAARREDDGQPQECRAGGRRIGSSACRMSLGCSVDEALVASLPMRRSAGDARRTASDAIGGGRSTYAGRTRQSSPMSSFQISGCAAMNSFHEIDALLPNRVDDLHAARSQVVLASHERADARPSPRAVCRTAGWRRCTCRTATAWCTSSSAGRPTRAGVRQFSSASVSPWRMALFCCTRRLWPTARTVPSSATSAPPIGTPPSDRPILACSMAWAAARSDVAVMNPPSVLLSVSCGGRA